jgi:hypothetical protein
MLQVMLHKFRRIHAAKRSLCRDQATTPKQYAC